jgi:indole-3-glycerol phosphate synthase
MLRQIVADKEKRLAEIKRKTPEEALRERIAHAGDLRPFKEALLGPEVSIIAEIKKASPTRGNFGLTRAVTEQALCYEAGGAAAVSVLTEEDHFLGSSGDLVQARSAVSLPVLRKDFIIDSYQLYESRLLCADAVLLIAGLLNTAVLRQMLSTCSALGLDAVVETRSAAEILRAMEAGAVIIGINNRDLATFVTDLVQTEKLARFVPGDVLLVSESGINTAQDMSRMAASGVNAVLVGEALVRASDPAQKIRELREAQHDQNKDLRN